MRITILILMVQLTFFSLIGQSAKKINIHINSNNGNSLPLSHVIVDKETHFIADEEGNITFSTLDERANIKISHIGYLSIDTIINVYAQSHYDFTLIANNYSLESITISDSKRLTEKTNWRIKDIVLHEYGFLVSSIEKSKFYIYLYDKNGSQVLKQETKFKHSTINKGLKTGHYHLMSEKSGQEIMVSTDTIMFLETSSILLYNKTVNHFKYSNSNYTISEELTKHNKNLTLSILDNKNFVRTPFYTAFDKEGYSNARKAYYNIIKMYNRAVDNDSSTDIDNGMKPPKVGGIFWDKDLFSLVINKDIHAAYHDFINRKCTKLKVITIVKNNKFYILDNFKKKMTIYVLNEEKISKENTEIALPENMKNGDFMMTDHKNELILSSDEGYYAFDIESHKLRPISFETKNFYFPKRDFVTNNQKYTLARKSMAKNKMYIHRGEMEEGH
ncbi:MAG: hypothetical protein ACI86M_003328 [Saprospiraceae bacterium]|jgi:hypothetical protein